MAIAMTSLGNGSATSSPTTGVAKAFVNDRLYLVAVTARGTSTVLTSITGGGITWEAAVQGAASSTGISICRGLVTSGAISEGLTVTVGGTVARITYNIVEVTGMDTSGTNGSGAIVQASTVVSGTATSGAATLSAFGDATNNAAYGAYAHNRDETSTQDTSYTVLGNTSPSATNPLSILTEYILGQDTSVAASWATSSGYVGAALEIKAAAAAASSGHGGLLLTGVG